MSLGWPSVGLKELASGQVRPAVLLRIGEDSPARMWSGAGDLAIPVDAVETEDEVFYKGVGELLNPPAVNQLINGLAERVEFLLSGDAVNAQVAAMAQTEFAALRQAPVHLGFLLFDSAWQILSPTAWLWEGEADSAVQRRDGSGSQVNWTIGVSVGSVFTARRRPQISYFTDADQRRRNEADAFFDQVKLYSAGTTKVWPT